MSKTAVHPARWHAATKLAALPLAALVLVVAVSAARAAAPAPAPAPAPAAHPAHPAAAIASGPDGHAGRPARQQMRLAPAARIDINSASLKQLMSLPGIGEAEAKKIIANRHYLSKAELVHKGVLPTGPYLSLKDHIVALQKKPTQRKS